MSLLEITLFRDEGNRQIYAMKEQTEALKRTQIQQQLNGSIMTHGGIMKKYEEDQFKNDIEDIKNTLESKKKERELRDMRRR